ncbi:hypothetical protein [Paenibacillus spongiae]|uniref:Uncharacterized protein n=1 Tax=Paenibacillus spongiae TaxID=2909671 RepID=A0ABY5S0X0_9BACL|nr:hypothetical protein [Paenibacillus spongiae]UVI27497.1 hypothetical protein L1F29_18690 [Paenibacillus spongiae]
MSVDLKNKFISHMDNNTQVFSWQVHENLTAEEAKAAADIIISTVQSNSKTTKVNLLVDNRFMERNGRSVVFTPDVNAIWEEAQRTVFPYVAKIAVLCSGTLMKMQMDRISRNSNIMDINKCFWNDNDQIMLQEAFDFLGISSNDLVKPKQG